MEDSKEHGSPRSLVISQFPLRQGTQRFMFCHHGFRADGTEAAPPRCTARGRGGAAGDAAGISARPRCSCRDPARTPSHPKGPHLLWRQSTTDTRGRGHSICHSPARGVAPNASLHPSEAGEHHPLSQQKSSGRAGGVHYPGSRRQVLKYPGIPPHTLNRGPLSPDTKRSV